MHIVKVLALTAIIIAVTKSNLKKKEKKERKKCDLE